LYDYFLIRGIDIKDDEFLSKRWYNVKDDELFLIEIFKGKSWEKLYIYGYDKIKNKLFVKKTISRKIDEKLELILLEQKDIKESIKCKIV
jgi:hypothetical protein